MNKIIHSLYICIVTLFVLSGCTDEEVVSLQEDITPSLVEIRLTGASGSVEEVNVNIQSISVNTSNGDEDNWEELTLLGNGPYNLLTLKNGHDTLLVSQEFHPSSIKQIKVELGNNNSITKGGVSHKLTFPTEELHTIIIERSDNLLSDYRYRLWINISAMCSIVETSTGEYQLRPVVRAYTDQTGVIQGIISPAKAGITVWAILGTDSARTMTDNEGFYRIPGLKPDPSWKLFFDVHENSGYKNQTVTDISIETGVTSILDVVDLTD